MGESTEVQVCHSTLPCPGKLTGHWLCLDHHYDMAESVLATNCDLDPYQLTEAGQTGLIGVCV